MEPKFKYGQIICIKWTPVESAIITPLGLMYSSKKDSIYGAFKVSPYKGDSKMFPISYKIHLEPVRESINRFLPMDRYTDSFSNIEEEMIFDDENLANKFVEEFLIP